MTNEEKLDSLDEKIDQIGLFVAVSEERLERMEIWQKDYCAIIQETSDRALKNKNDISWIKKLGTTIASICSAVIIWLITGVE